MYKLPFVAYVEEIDTQSLTRIQAQLRPDSDLVAG